MPSAECACASTRCGRKPGSRPPARRIRPRCSSSRRALSIVSRVFIISTLLSSSGTCANWCRLRSTPRTRDRMILEIDHRPRMATAFPRVDGHFSWPAALWFLNTRGEEALPDHDERARSATPFSTLTVSPGSKTKRPSASVRVVFRPAATHAPGTGSFRGSRTCPQDNQKAFFLF